MVEVGLGLGVLGLKVWGQGLTIMNISSKAKNTDKGWSSRSRRRMIETILDEWVSGGRKRPTVRRLLAALSAPHFLDVKIKVKENQKEGETG